MPAATQVLALRQASVTPADHYFESDEVISHILGDPASKPKIFVDIDLGSNSIKMAVQQMTENGLIDITKEVFTKFNESTNSDPVSPSEQCRLGRNAIPNNITNASLDDDGIDETLKLLRGFMRVIHFIKVPLYLKIAGTGIVRNSLNNPAPEGRRKTESFLAAAEDIVGFPPSVMSEKAEIRFSLIGILLHGTDEATWRKRPSSGVMYYGGGNTIQVAEFRDDEIVGNHAAVLQIGSRSLDKAGDANAHMDRAVAMRAPWLNPEILQETDGVFGGGMFRQLGRVMAFLQEDTNLAFEHMPVEGYTFTFKTKVEYKIIRDNLLKVQKMTANELFKRATTKTKVNIQSKIASTQRQVKALEDMKASVIDLNPAVAKELFKRLGCSQENFAATIDTMIKNTDCIKIGERYLTADEADKLVKRWERKVEKRFPDLPNDAQIVLNHLTRMYGENGERLGKHKHSITFSGGNTRLAMAANGLH